MKIIYYKLKVNKKIKVIYLNYLINGVIIQNNTYKNIKALYDHE